MEELIRWAVDFLNYIDANESVHGVLPYQVDALRIAVAAAQAEQNRQI